MEGLLACVEVDTTILHAERLLYSTVKLPEKDQPILLAAISAGATHLLIGDFRHFGPYYEERIEGVLILPPGDYLSLRGG